MRYSQQVRRRLARAFAHALADATPRRFFVMDPLENRRLMSGSGEIVQTPITPVLANITAPAGNDVTLNQHFFDATLPGTLATFNTSEGTIQVGLTDAATPQTVANFLSYVNSGAYNNTIFHRSVDLNTNLGGSPNAPATIIQGGGYNLSNNSLNHIPTNGTVPDEYTTELYGNVAGTLVMAKTSQANSANSEWYFNVTDNTQLDIPTTDSNGVQTSYTVFGKVLSGANAINTIAALPTDNLGSGLDTVPIVGLTLADLQAGAAIGASNLVYTTGITTEVGTTYTVSSDNKALVTPLVTNGILSFSYGTGLFGTAEVTVTAKNLDGTSASTTFAVTVPNPATPSAGPVTVPFTAPFTVTGTTNSFAVLGGATDSQAALNTSSLSIVTQPGHGTASVDPTTGFITYTPAAGYIGPDSLTYTIADYTGQLSAPTTVTLDAVPTAVKLNVSAGTSLVFTQPDGVIGHLSVTGGIASVTFTDFQVTTRRHGHTIFASGAGTDITDITVTNAVQDASLSLTSTGPLSIGTLHDTNELVRFYAPNATLSGNSSIGMMVNFTAAALNSATLNIGALPGGFFTNLSIANVTNSDVNGIGNLGLVKSRKWIITDGLAHAINAPFINDLEVPGVFDENLNLNYNRYALANARVGTPTGSWKLNGQFTRGTLGTPGTNWSLNANNLIENLTFTGNLSNTIIAAAVSRLTVKGITSGAIIQTNGTFGNYLLVGRLTFVGAVKNNTVIFSSGNIGAITAPSFTDSRIYAGVNISVAQAGALAAQAGDLTSNASIGSIVFNGRAGNNFSNSLITAEAIRTLSVGRVATANKSLAEGISAHRLTTVVARLTPGGNLHAGPAQLKSAALLKAYESKAKLALGDFEINLF